MLEAVLEFVQGYTSISTMAFRAICGIQLLPIVRFNDPARFLCTDSVQLRSMMGQTVMLHGLMVLHKYYLIY